MGECERGYEMRVKSALPLLCAASLLALQGICWASEGGGHGGGLNWTDFAYRLVAFLILAAILVKLLKKPISSFLVSRREEIQKLLAELEVKRLEAEQRSAEYKSKLAALEDETKRIIAELIAEGEAEREKIIQAAQKQADYIKQQADLAIQQEIKAAKESLQEEIGQLTVAAAEALVRKNLQPADQDRLVRDFMTRVVEAK
ncbi:MAG: F-type H+-transporting ATPase subunit b [Thermodesulfobacteriota bacterium]|nr:F-type H+-transporting ATPase subunit b [Thermodesulfobacteriota bacterium]